MREPEHIPLPVPVTRHLSMVWRAQACCFASPTPLTLSSSSFRAAPAEAPASTAASPAGSGDTTAVVNEWVDVVVRVRTPVSQLLRAADSLLCTALGTVVQEMAASADLGDARRRASGVLTAFEAAVKGDAQATRGALESALRDTALLKRAVAIQQQRHHEASVTAAQEIESLKAALAQQQSELHAAQMNAFALSVHLRQALSGPNAAGNGGPDWVA